MRPQPGVGQPADPCHPLETTSQAKTLNETQRQSPPLTLYTPLTSPRFNFSFLL